MPGPAMSRSPSAHPALPQSTHDMHPTVREYVRSREIAEGYDHCFAETPLFQYDCRFLEEYLPPAGRVLDLGCGTGRHLTFLQSLGYTTIGIDLNPHMLRCARENARVCGMAPRLVRADMTSLPLAETARFDGILMMFSTLGLIRGHAVRAGLLGCIRTHLRIGGRLLLHVHNAFHPNSPARLSRNRMVSRVRAVFGLEERGDAVMPRYRGLQDLYCHFFTADEVKSLLGAAGFRILEIRPLNARRDGAYTGPDAMRHANGFLIAAEPNENADANFA